MKDSTGRFDPNCPFCKIARGLDKNTEIICEGPTWVAFFPTEPATPGHTLVAPREHVPNLWAAEDSLGAELMRAVIKVGRAIQDAIAPAGMNLISSSGVVAEQSVFHLHLHVVPRYEGDAIDPIWPAKARADEQQKERIAKAVMKACANV